MENGLARGVDIGTDIGVFGGDETGVLDGLAQGVYNENKLYLENINLPFVKNGLLLYIDAGNIYSYSGSGTGITWRDLSANNNDLTTSGNPTYVPTESGYFSFSSSTQYANRTSVISSASINMSMCAWIRPSNLNQLGMAVHNGSERAGATNGVGFGLSNGSGGTGAKLTILHGGAGWIDSGYTFPTANIWYYIVVLRNTAGVNQFFVNGVQTANTSNNAPSAATNNFSVGRMDPFGTIPAPFAGGVSIVQFYRRDLSLIEIVQNYNATKSRFGL